jgi:hypothetical protein
MIKSTLKVLDFWKGNGSSALMSFTILVGLRVSSWIPMKVAKLVVVWFKKCSLMKQVLHVGQLATIGAHVFCLGLLKAKISKINIWEDHHN